MPSDSGKRVNEDRRTHTPWDSTTPIELAATCKDKISSLHEAYKKHSTELISLEDRHNKSLLLILGLFGAGATAMSTVSIEGQTWSMLCFMAIVACAGGVGLHAAHETHDLRKAVRDLLVRCELAMQLYTSDEFVSGKPLYDDSERDYPHKGGGLRIVSYIVIIFTGALLIFLIWNNYNRGLPKKDSGASSSLLVSR
jgi:hypothetical protein